MTADDTKDVPKACVAIPTLANCLRAVRNERYSTKFDLESGDYDGYEAEVQGWIDTLEDVESEVEASLLKAVEQSDWTAEEIDRFIQDYNL